MGASGQPYLSIHLHMSSVEVEKLVDGGPVPGAHCPSGGGVGS